MTEFLFCWVDLSFKVRHHHLLRQSKNIKKWEFFWEAAGLFFSQFYHICIINMIRVFSYSWLSRISSILCYVLVSEVVWGVCVFISISGNALQSLTDLENCIFRVFAKCSLHGWMQLSVRAKQLLQGFKLCSLGKVPSSHQSPPPRGTFCFCLAAGGYSWIKTNVSPKKNPQNTHNTFEKQQVRTAVGLNWASTQRQHIWVCVLCRARMWSWKRGIQIFFFSSVVIGNNVSARWNERPGKTEWLLCHCLY